MNDPFAPQLVERTRKIIRRPNEIDGTIQGKDNRAERSSMYTVLHHGAFFGSQILSTHDLFALSGKTPNLGPTVPFVLRKDSESMYLYFGYPLTWGSVRNVKVNGFTISDFQISVLDQFRVYRSPYKTSAVRVDFEVDFVRE